MPLLILFEQVLSPVARSLFAFRAFKIYDDWARPERRLCMHWVISGNSLIRSFATLIRTNVYLTFFGTIYAVLKHICESSRVHLTDDVHLLICVSAFHCRSFLPYGVDPFGNFCRQWFLVPSRDDVSLTVGTSAWHVAGANISAID